jgi:hypothetical protein
MPAITSPTAAPRGVSDAVVSRCERKVARSSMTVSPRILFGTLSPRIGNPPLRETQFAE